MVSERYSKRHSDEIKHRAGVKWPFESWLVNESIVPWNLREYGRVLQSYFPEGGNGKHVLDCGCGYGTLSVFLAKSGASVKAFDISPNCVRIARRLARENDVESHIEFSEGVIENLTYPDEVFDIVVGTRILHHVETEPAAREMFRVLKPGGMAIFWEPTYMNPLLRVMRKIYRAIPGIPKHGTTYEHPLSREEIGILAGAFKGRLRMHAAPFVFFSHLAGAAHLDKWKPIGKLANGMDQVLDCAVPFLRKWSYHRIFVLEKERKDSERSLSTSLHPS